MPRAAAVLLAGRLAALPGLAALSACTIDIDTRGYIQHDRKAFDVEGTADLRLSTFDGSIEVRGWDRPRVEVDIEKRAASKELVESIEIVAVQEGGQIHVEARRPGSGTWDVNLMQGPGRSVRLVAYVPVASNVLAQSGDGSISAERVKGRVELRTDDGSIRGVEIGGTLHVTTGDGSIRLENIEGTLDGRTGDGSISVSGRPTALTLHTDDGSMTIRVEDGAAMSEDWSLATEDGRVVVYLPRDFPAEIDATTGDGRVRADLDLDESSTEANGRRELRGRIGSGGHTLRIRTASGSISLRPS